MSVFGLSYAVLAICITISLTTEKTPSFVQSNIDIIPHLGEVIPIIGLKNASTVLQQHLSGVQSLFENVMSDPYSTWTLHRNVENLNLSIHMQETANGLPPYVKSTIFIKAEPKSAYKLFQWRNLHDTLSIIDPFYDSADMLLKVSKECMVIRKVRVGLIELTRLLLSMH